MAGDAALAGFGIGIVPASVVDGETPGTQVAALPGPISEADWDGWLWHSVRSFLASSTTPDPAFGLETREIEVDSKAMRTWDQGEEALVVVGEVDLLSGTPDVFVEETVLRLLLKPF